MRIYQAVVQALEGLGVDVMFGGAGENDATLLLALKYSTKIKTIVVRNEQAASFMACSYAMITRRLGVCFATAGPGAFNLFSGLAVALSDSHPVLAISGFANTDWTGKGELNETSGVNRTPDSQAMFAATTKRSYLLKDPARICDVLEEAINLAFEGRPGPVHLHIPENFTHPGVHIENYRDLQLKVQPVLPIPDQIAAAAELVAQAIDQKKRVLALIGCGAVLSGAGSDLRTFVERFQVPFITTLDGKGIIAENHPLALGVFADSGHRSARQAFLQSDVVLAVGNSFAQHGTFDFHPDLFAGKSLVHVNIDAQEINKVYKADVGVTSDAKPAVAALHHALAHKVRHEAAAAVVKDSEPSTPIVHDLPLIHPGQMAQSLSKLLPDNSVVLADAGAHLAWLAYYLELSRGQLYRKPGSFGPMACHVNGALGVKVACPERTVVVGCGDGGYLLSGFELMTAVQYNIPVIWIIFNDGEFKLIKLYQLSTFGESGLIDFNNPDYAGYAKACGAEGHRVETLAAFETAFQAAIASAKPTIIDAAITRSVVPHYSPTPTGVVGAVYDFLEKRESSADGG